MTIYKIERDLNMKKKQAKNSPFLFVSLCVLIMFIGFTAVISASGELTNLIYLSSTNADISQPVISDDFYASPLNQSIWTFIDPLGDAILNVTDNHQVSITVPAGTSHDAGNNKASRIMQSVGNSDINVEVKFESPLTDRYQMQGVIVQQDDSNYLRFEFFTDGTDIRVYAASISGGTATKKSDVTIDPGNPLYLRVEQQEDQWIQSYSYNGINWVQAANFSHPLTVTSVGPFIGNAGSSPPAFTGLIDYFFNTSSPIIPEDNGTDQDPPIIVIHPANQNVAVDDTATFTVLASGTAPLSYQWQKDGVNISGATDASYTTPLIKQSDNGTAFRCIVSNDFGTVTSDEAELILDATPPTITVWYGTPQKFGQIGNPQQWINILGNTHDPSGIASLNYSLNNGISQPLSIGPDGLRLQSNGDFNIEIDHTKLDCGNNQVIINATDSFGNVKNETVTVDYSCNNTWPDTYSINWSSVTSIQDPVQVVDGLWIKEPNSIRPSVIGYDRLIAVGNMTWDDYEITVPITINEPLDSSSPHGPNFGVIMRWQGHYDRDGTQPRPGWWPLGALGVYIWDSQLKDYRLKIIGNDMKVIANDMNGKHLEVGVTYMFKMRAQTINGNTYYSLKVWEESTPEPLEWTISGNGVAGELKQGSALLASHYSNVSFGDVNITPALSTGPIIISNVETIADASSATIRWDTDKLSTSEVAYGSSKDYGHGSVVNSTLVTSHEITLTGLNPGTLYHYQITSTDEGGNHTNTSDLTFTTLSAPSNIISDDFSASPLNTTLWTKIDPNNDATFEMVGSGTSDALLNIGILAGTSHDVWDGSNLAAPRIMQSVSDMDFEIEVKFESQLTSQYQTQGVIIQENDSEFLRFDIFTDGTNIRVYAASISGGTDTTKSDVTIDPGNPLYLRVKRQGDLWTQSYSYDGIDWTTAANFNHPLTVTSVGPFIGNAGSSAPAFTGLIDYFFNSASPIIPEDPDDVTPPSIIDKTPTGANISVSTQISVTFSESMNTTSVDSAFSTNPSV
ncbi:MAG: DUF1349 domain-containing protein, partial [ANME-2 cluster archaeon]|nr:DUF1349 domain-containing protein [ANME-2 cluster archaeon]